VVIDAASQVVVDGGLLMLLEKLHGQGQTPGAAARQRL
jgi:hypothetical protein